MNRHKVALVAALAVGAMVVAACSSTGSAGGTSSATSGAGTSSAAAPGSAGSAVGAAGSGSASTAGTPNLSGSVTLLKHFNDFEKDYNIQLSDGFTKEHPGVKVTVVTPQTGAVFAKFQTLVAGGQPPTVYLANLNYLPQLYKDDALVPLDLKQLGVSSIDELAKQYIPGALDPYTRNGSLYGIPEEVSNYQTWANKSYFEAAGLGVPKTWDDVCAAGKKVSIVKDGVPKREVIALPTNFSAATGLILDAVAREFGANLFSEDGTEAHLTDPGVVKEFQMFQDLVFKCQAFFPSMNGSTTAQERVLFGEGQSAMLLDAGSWYAPQLAQQYPKVSAVATVAPYPTVEGHSPENDIYGYAYVVPKGQLNETTSAYLDYLKDQGETAFKLGLYSGLASLADTETAKSTPFWESNWAPSLAEGKAQPLLVNASQIYDILQQAFNQVVINHADVTKTLEAAQRQISPLLNKK